MKTSNRLLWLVALPILLLAGMPLARAGSQPVAIQGYVLDSACAFTKNLSKPISTQCALSCADAGSPLVVMTADGTIYWPISNTMPAKGQNSRLRPFAGKKVSVKGTVYERSGSKAVVIASVEAAK